jgi:hypothetical protein
LKETIGLVHPSQKLFDVRSNLAVNGLVPVLLNDLLVEAVDTEYSN